MNLKALYLFVLTMAMVSAQACANENYRRGSDDGDAMSGPHHGMGMHHDQYQSSRHHRGHAAGKFESASDLMAMAKFRGIHRLNLSDDQRKKFKDIKHKLKKDLWQLMGKMIDVKFNLRELWEADKPDPAKVGAAYKDMFDLQRQAIELRVAARNKIYDMLSAEQREQFRGAYHGGGHHRSGHGEGHGDGHGSGHMGGHGPM